MPTYIGLLEPKKPAQKNGAVALVYALEAPNKKAAEGIIVGKLWEAYPAAGENFFNPKVVEDQPGCPRPPLGVFDEQFAIENEFDVDGKCWVPREVEAPPTGPIDLMTQPANVRIAAVVMYGEGEIDNGQLSLVVDMLNDEDTPDDTGMRAVIDALVSVTQVGAMYPNAVYNLVSALFDQAGDDVPAKADILAFAQEWVSNPNEREKIKLGSPAGASKKNSDGCANDIVDLMKLSARERFMSVLLFGNAPVTGDVLSQIRECLDALVGPNANIDEEEDRLNQYILYAMEGHLPVSHMHVEGLNNMLTALRNHFSNQQPGRRAVSLFIKEWTDNPDKRGELSSTSTEGNGGVSDYNTLSMHTALSIMAVHPATAKAGDVKNAKEIIASRDSVWRAWDKTFRVITGILDVDTDTRHSIISDGLKNLKLVNNDDERLHFVKSRLAGNPSCPELANYGQQTETPLEVENLGDGKFSVDGLIGEQTITASNEVEKTEVATTEPVSDAAALQAKETLDDLGYGVYATEPEQKSELLQRAEDNAAAAAQLVQQLHADDFQQRAAQVEQAIAEQPEAAQENLQIWKQVQRTDPRYTSELSGVGYTGTSINAEYMFMRATEIFGPVGIGWGFEVIEDKMIPGAPMTEAIYDNGKFVRMEILRNVDGSLVFELNHSLKIKFWYKADYGDGVLESYGATPYLYKATKRIVADGEAMKKSLTDAIKKALSMLGFSADIYLGMFDRPEYKAENEIEFSIRNASDKAEDVTRLRQELDDKFKTNTATMKSAKTASEVSGIASSLTRVLGVHLDSARGKADHDYAKYLESRLNRLEDIKAECLNKLKAGTQV